MAGLLIALVDFGFGLLETQIVAAAVPVGIFAGALCFSLALWRPPAARVRRRR